MKKVIILPIILLGLLFSLPGLAADWYVDGDSGSDATGNGSSSSPYQTITKALTEVVSGDTVYCKGTIQDNFNINDGASGTASNYTTITAWPENSATLDANGANYNITLGNGLEYVTISNLIFTNAVRSAIYSNEAYTGYIKIENNDLSGLTGGVLATAIDLTNSENLEISGNTLDGESTASYAMDINSAAEATIEGNMIRDFTKNGIIFNTLMSDSDIKNNIIYNIGGDDYFYSAAINVADSFDIRVINNTIYNAYDDTQDVSGIMLMTSSETMYDITIENNIINTTNYAINFDGEYNGIEIDYNNFYNNNKLGSIGGTEYDTLAEWQAETDYDDHSIAEDPEFTSIIAGSENLHLKNISPCIDTGTLNASVDVDFDDEDRPYNVTDMGADELPTPGIPTNISVTSKPKQVTVTWDEDSTYPSNQYNIQYWPKSDPTNVTILTNTVNSQTITGLKPAKLYFVAVQGQYNSDYSLYADDYSSSLEYGAKPKKVTKLKVLKKYTTATSVKIRWKKYKRINRYVIKVMNKKGKKIKNVTVKKKINFVKNTNKKFVKKVIKNLTPGKTYKVNVRAKKKVGDEWLKGKRSKKKSAKTLSS